MPTFNPGDYQAALEESQFAQTKLQQASSDAQSQQIETQQFALDTQIEYKKKQKEASSIFSKWKTGSGLLSGLLTVAMGITNPFAAAAIAATLAGVGTKYGKDKAMGKLSGKWLKGQTTDTGEEFDSQVIKNALLSGITAGVTTHMAGAKAAKGADVTKATGGGAVVKTPATGLGGKAVKISSEAVGAEELARLSTPKLSLGEKIQQFHTKIQHSISDDKGLFRGGKLASGADIRGELTSKFAGIGKGISSPSATATAAPDPYAVAGDAWSPVIGSGFKAQQIPGQMARNLKTGIGAWGDQATSMMDNITGPGSPGMGFSPKVQLLSHYLGFGGKKVI